MFIEPGVTAQPLLQPFTITQTPSCGHPVEFSWKDSPPCFASLASVAATSGGV